MIEPTDKLIELDPSYGTKALRAAAPNHRYATMPEQKDLFRDSQLPEGLVYRPEFLSPTEEAELLEVIDRLPLEEAQYREWRAKRRIVSYGGRYDFAENELLPAEAIPQFLHPLRARLAAWLEIEVTTLDHAVVAEYRPGTPLGWHRDVPHFELVLGVSLAGRARMRLRPYPHKGGHKSIALELEPRSAYVLAGPARWAWQHAISPTRSLRYSITFRTLRQRNGASQERA